MKKLLFTTLTILICSAFTKAQLKFQNGYGDPYYTNFYSLDKTLDGGFIMAGDIDTNLFPDIKLLLIKADESGNLLWGKTYNSPVTAFSQKVINTHDGGFILAGTKDLQSINDLILLKIDSLGNISWANELESVVGYDVTLTDDGGFIALGQDAQGGLYAKMLLIKVDSAGNTIWNKEIGGGNIGMFGRSVIATWDGGYMVTGSGFSSSSYLFLTKTDSMGNNQWTKFYGGTISQYGLEVQQTKDSGYIAVGTTNSFGAGNNDVYLIKTNSVGDTLWTKTYGGATVDIGRSVKETMDGGFIIAGNRTLTSLGYQACLIKTDSLGNLIWSKVYGGTSPGDDNFWEVHATLDSGYVAAGYNSIPSYGAAWLVKTDNLGNSGCNETNGTIVMGSTTSDVTLIVPNVSNGLAMTPTSFITDSIFTYQSLCTNVAFEEFLTSSNALIFPNPSTGNFIISFENYIIVGNIEVVDILGQKVFSENILYESKKEINLRIPTSGIYFVKVYDGKKSYCKKLIVKHD